MSGEFTRNFDATYNFQKNGFEGEHDTTRPIFYKEKVIDPISQELVEVEMVKVQSPGEHLNVFGGKVTQEHKNRWPKHYEAFKKGEESVDGTPLSKWPEVSNNVDFMNQLRGFGFHTVEDISKMQDGAQRLFHGSLTWKKKAEAFLAQQAKVKAAEAVTAQAGEMEALKAQLAELQAQLAKKKPGRKAKAESVAA